MHRKIAVVMTCFNKAQQLGKTLATVAMSRHTNYHVIVVDDASTKPLYLPPMEAEVVRIEPSEKTWIGTTIACNMGIHRALSHDPDIVVIQNAECYHVGDVLMHANDHVTDGNYISFGCWNQSAELAVSGDYDIYEVIAADNPLRTDGGSTGWYNHPVWRRTGYDFCSAMSTGSMLKLNGHDERFKVGIGYADNDLVRRVKKLGLNLLITEEPFVVHQWHERGDQSAALQVAKAVYNITRQEANYRAQHIVTEDFS